jgi:hypothetical protein
VLQIYRTVEREIRVMPREIKPLLGHYSEDYLLELGVPEIYLKPFSSWKLKSSLWSFLKACPRTFRSGSWTYTGKKWCRSTQAQHPGGAFSTPCFPATLPLHSGPRRAPPSPDLSLGEVDGLPSPRAKGGGGSHLPGPGTGHGTAGTGKTVVALHRVKTLVAKRYPGEPILLTTFNRFLAAYLRRAGETSCWAKCQRRLRWKICTAWLTLAQRTYWPRSDRHGGKYVPWLEEAAQGLAYEPEFLLSEFALVDSLGPLYEWDL